MTTTYTVETRYSEPRVSDVETSYTRAPTVARTGYTRPAYTVETGYDAAPPLPVAPVNTVAPVVTGTPTEGEILSCTTGTWTGTLPISYGYQWWRTIGPGSTAIGGATSSTYLLTATEVGEDVWCVVEGTNVAGSADEQSNTVGPIASASTPPVNTVAPVASGTVRIGEVLSCTTGTWTGTPTPTYAYQWRRDGVDIGGATASTHTVVDLDMATELDCEVTATNVAGAAAEPSNTLASPWQPILVARPGVLIFDGLDPQCYGGASVSSPVEDLFTVDGVALGTQTVTASQGTRLSDALSLDGSDDHYICDAHAAYLESANTIAAGFYDPAAAGTLRHLVAASKATSTAGTLTYRVSYVSGANSTANQTVYSQDGTTIVRVNLFGLSTPWDIITRNAGVNATTENDKLDASLTAISSGTRSAVAQTFERLTIGATRHSAGPTIAAYWQGKIRHLAIHDEAWSDTDALLYRTCALAAGVM